MKNYRYYLAAVSAFFIWGTMSLVVRPLSDYPSLDLIFYRVFFSATIMIFFVGIARRKMLLENIRHYHSLNKKDKAGFWKQSLGGAIFITSNWFFFIYVVNHISVKAGAFAYLICPILTAVMAVFILKEKLNRNQWLAVGISAVCCIVLGIQTLHDVMYSLIVAVSYAAYLISQRPNFGFDKLLLLSIQVIFSSLLLLPFYPTYSGPLPQEWKFYILMIVMAVLFTIIPLLLSLFALKGLKSAVVGILMYISPIIGLIVAVLHFHEKVSAIQLTAYGVILFCILLFNWKKSTASVRQ